MHWYAHLWNLFGSAFWMVVRWNSATPYSMGREIAVPVITTALVLRTRLKEWRMPTVKEVLVSTAIAIGVIIGTSVVAWGVAIPVAIYRDHQYFVHDASVLRDSNSKLKTAYTDGYQKGKSEQLEIDAKPVVPEAADSLRRRTTKLASDINEYLSDWEMHRPAPGSNAPEATIEQ